jgi:hypothetical protein
MIYDLRFTISGGRSRGVEDLGQFDGLGVEILQAESGKEAGSLGKLDPKGGFVGLFENDGNLVNEIGPRFASKRGSIIRRNRTPAACHLAGNRSSGRIPGQGTGEFQDADGELHRSLHQFIAIHEVGGDWAPVKSSIINRKS